MRIGHGYDVHKLVEGRDLIVGGVKIEHHLGLLGHSDADECSIGKLIQKGFYYCAAIALGTIAYYGALQFILNHYDRALDDYHGINEMGQMSLSELLSYVRFAIVTYFMMPLNNYCDLAQTELVKLSYLLVGGLMLITVMYILVAKIRKILPAVFMGVLIIFFALAVDFIEVMVPKGYVYTIMVFPFVLVLCAPLVLWELVELPEKVSLKKVGQAVGSVMMALVLFVCVNYGYQANTNYMALYYANQKTENYLNTLVVQVRMTDGFTADKEWAFVGKIQDPQFSDPWESVPTYGGNPSFQKLINDYGQGAWVQNYLGIEIPYASEARVSELAKTDQVKGMPCWPDAGSIAVVDGTMVIKFEELAE